MTTRAPRTLRAVTTALSTGAALTLPTLIGTALPAQAADDTIGRVFALTNAERADAGCAPLGRSPSAGRAAQGYAHELAGESGLSHTGDDGSDFSDRMRAAGNARPGAENIARGQDTPEEVVQSWMDSPGHRENILDCSLRTLGIGHAGEAWVQDFGR
jgi:uncharacterized protein YkwD